MDLRIHQMLVRKAEEKLQALSDATEKFDRQLAKHGKHGTLRT